MCEREPQATAARASGDWTEDLKQHVAHCPECQDALLVAGFFSGTGGEETAVPAAGLVWFKSQLRLRREAMDRAERPLVWGQRVAAAIAATAMLWLSAWAAGTSAPLAAALIGSFVVLGLAAGGLLLAARDRK